VSTRDPDTTVVVVPPDEEAEGVDAACAGAGDEAVSCEGA
jgi:hypothetical protein